MYSSEGDQEKIQRAQKSVLSKISQEEGNAVLSVAQSRVRIEEDFKQRLVQGIRADEDYSEILEKLQDPAQMNEVSERGQKYKMQRGVLKTHEEKQSSTYEYWRTVIPNDQDLKKTVLKEMHCVPYSGHPGFA